MVYCQNKTWDLQTISWKDSAVTHCYSLSHEVLLHLRFPNIIDTYSCLIYIMIEIFHNAVPSLTNPAEIETENDEVIA